MQTRVCLCSCKCRRRCICGTVTHRDSHSGITALLTPRPNRLLVKAQVSALSEGVGNITSALKRRGMWSNTVLVFMGDSTWLQSSPYVGREGGVGWRAAVYCAYIWPESRLVSSTSDGVGMLPKG